VIVAANEATYAAWNAHDADAVAAVFAEDAVVVDSGVGEVRGREAIRARGAGMLAAFPDLRLDRRSLVVDDRANADEWTLTGTHQGEYFGLAATGRPIEVHGATFSRFGPDGLVVHDTNYVDVQGLLRQLTGD
jgi:C-1 hydroxylase